jgi:hypothetical protein
MHDVARLEPEPLARLDNLFYGALFGMASTWYIELGAGDQEHTFDIGIIAERGLMPGCITAHKILGSSGRLAPDQAPLRLVRSRSGLELKHLQLRGTARLAFRVEPERIPVEFDFRIDGDAATGATFLGASLAGPEEMPFTQNGKRPQALSEGRPAPTLTPPYILVWFEKAAYRGETFLNLDEETRKELRALGYIQ